MSRWVRSALLIGGLGAVIGAAVATGAIPGGDGKISACYGSNGEVRVIDIEKSPPASCNKGWKPLNWSQTIHVPQTTTYTRALESTAPPNTVGPSFGVQTATPMCDEGDVVVGGGINIGSQEFMVIFITRPRIVSGEPEGWTGGVINHTNLSQTFSVYARCQHTE